MFKRRALDLTEDLLQGEQAVHDAIIKVSSSRTKAHTLLLRWASGEDNSLIFSLFKRLAEIQWMYNEATKQMAEKHLRLSKAFKQIFQEEKVLEESRKELQGSSAKITKLQKQVDVASKKGDHLKKQSLEADLSTQTSLCESLSASVEIKAQKHELYKIVQLKKALVCQAEGVITLSGHCQQLYASQMQLIDLLPDTPLENSDTTAEEVNHRMANVVKRVSNLLDFQPPPQVGMDQSPPTDNFDKTTPLSAFGVLLKRHKSAENLVTVESKFQQREEAVRPEANYTKGMYCEIMIPGPGSSNAFPTVHNSPVLMRRSQSSSSPATSRRVMPEKHRSVILMDTNKVPNDGLSGAAVPLDTDSETISIPDTSSEDLPCDEEVDQGYARITIIPSPSAKSSTSTSPDIDNCNGYARPADVVPFEPLNYNWDRQRRTGKRNRNIASPPIPEGKSVSPYETIDNIRKLKKEQQKNQKMEQEKTSEKLQESDEHIYSRPFDAISCNSPLKVSTESTKNQVIVAPPIPRSNGRYPNEKAVKSLHQANGKTDEENLSPPITARSFKGRSLSAKKYKKQPASTVPPQKDVVVPENKTHFLVELEKKIQPGDQQSEEDESNPRRSGSAGSDRGAHFKPIAERISKLRSGQATVINGTKKPLPAPKPRQ